MEPQFAKERSLLPLIPAEFEDVGSFDHPVFGRRFALLRHACSYHCGPADVYLILTYTSMRTVNR